MIRELPGVVGVRVDGRCLFVHLRSAADTPNVVTAVVRAGLQVETVRNTAGSLEDVFSAMMQEADA